MIDERAILGKLVRMFRPYDGDRFLDYPGSDTITGPSDRAMIGIDTYFPKEWLIEDYGFTDEEASWLISAVIQMNHGKTR